MFDKSVIESLQQIKDRKKMKFVSIFNDGSKTEDDGSYILTGREDNINSYGSDIDYFLKDTVKKLSFYEKDYDQLELKFKVGLIYNKETLGENNEILPTSELLNDKARYYTGNVYTYQDNELITTLETKNMVNIHGIIDYNKFMKQIKKEGMTFTGPDSFEELKEFILSNNTEEYSIVIDFNKKLEQEVEQVQEVPEIQEMTQVQQVKHKKRSLFRR